ncbi:transaldolase [Hyphomicrobium sp. D-2]|uniref:transaldolase n=1 Tax=Hyphomicrobium sp. D-2 TaxID=3041621 RepID=UPI0024576B1B|nr:transaldolase [Hyphomicrobium sp. D-2]MDH4981041.1 transaldolase [Hyphomicrobium sp. D-2]
MTATKELHRAGQSIWIDDITRSMLDSGRLAKMIAEFSVTGLTSNPTIFEKAIGSGSDYDAAAEALVRKGLSDEELFFELALDDLRRAADLFRPIYDRTSGVDGWVSLEVSPLLAYDADATISEAKRLYAKADRPNLFIKIPGTHEGLPAIEAATFAGVPVNVTLLFTTGDYLAAAEAYVRGLERRVAAGLDANVRSVASVFISRWDRAIVEDVPDAIKNRLGIAIGQSAYRAYRELIASDRWQRLENAGARPQRLLFASTSSKDKRATDTLYIDKLAAPNTVNTMPEDTLRAFADHGTASDLLAANGGDCDAIFAAHAEAGVDVEALGRKLQADGAKAFVASWRDLLASIASKTKALA